MTSLDLIAATALPAAGTLDGTEVVSMTKAGVTKKSTTSAIAALGGGGLTTEEVQDAVAAMLVEGDNVTLTYSDGANTLTIGATGGGGGGGGGTFDSPLDIPKASPDTPDDDFDSTTLDTKWTAVNGTVGTVNLVETGDVAKYDLTSSPGRLLLQVGAAAGLVQFRQDYTLADGESIIAKILPATPMGPLTTEEVGIRLNLSTSTTLSRSSGTFVELEWLASSSAPRSYVYCWNGATEYNLGSNGISPTAGMYLRWMRSGSTYSAALSLNGRNWAVAPAFSPGVVLDHIWIGAFSGGGHTPVPIHSIDWVRLGTNDTDPWPLTTTGGGGAGVTHQVTNWTGAGSNLSTSSTSFVDIDSTNIPALSLTLAVGDVVDLELICTVAYGAGNVMGFDWLIDRPTSGDTNLRGSAWAAHLYEPGLSGSDANTQHIGGTFVATEAGVHTFKPQWRVSSSTGTINLTGTYWGPITHSVRNFGPVT